MSSPQKQDINKNMKYVSLVTLMAQNALFCLSIRYCRTRPGYLFNPQCAVILSEILKLLTCCVLVWNAEGRTLGRLKDALHNTIVKQPVDTLKVGVPSILYLLQNNLLYLAAANLDVATYQITYQMKIMTTAVLSVILLKRKLIPTQWLALMVLMGGVVMVQLSDVRELKTSGQEQNKVVGFLAALTICFLSGFAGVYFEKILKGSDVSVWMRNIQLALLALPLGIITLFIKDAESIAEHGFLGGFDSFVWFVVVQQAVGGLLVAVVVKYADNILKGFAFALAIIITCLSSIFIFDFVISLQFVMGAALVISSTFMYSYVPKVAPPKLTEEV